MPYVALWARAFAVTVLVELGVATPLLAGAERRLWRRMAIVAFAQLASHPAVWFIFPEIGLGHAFLFVAESWAVAIEILFYRVTLPSLPWSRAFGVSLLANGASFAVGLALRATLHWF